MARKVIIDCDPGIDDAVALCLAFFDPQLEVVAVTATSGNVPAGQASRNVQAIVEQLDPARRPRLGEAHPVENGPVVDTRHIYGPDGLGNVPLPVPALHHPHPSEKVICDQVRAAPEQVTILAFGPLTNIARAFRRDPGLASLVGQIIMMGGSVQGIGNITPAAEFNMYCDPEAARQVFRSPTTKTLVPLDVTNQVVFSLDFVDQLPSEESRVGAMLRGMIPYAFRSYRQQLGLEGILLHDAVALMAALHPELFETEEMAGDVETTGELTSGATVFDRRQSQHWRVNMEVATAVDVAAVRDCIIRGLVEAGRRT